MSIEKIVLDTNALLQMLNRKSPYHHILQKIVKGEISLCVSNDILTPKIKKTNVSLFLNSV